MMSRRKQLNPRAMKEEGETNEKRMKKSEESSSRDEISPFNDQNEHITHPISDTIQSIIKTESPDETLIQCALCDGQFNSVALLQMHTITLHIPQSSQSVPSFVCPQCDSSLPSMTAFALHMKCHLSEKLIQCPICGKSVREEDEYLDHLSDHIIVKSIRYSCTDCTIKKGSDFSFREESELLVHSMEKHSRLQIFCTICSKVFGDDLTFKMHLIDKHNESIELFHCSLCEKSFDSKLLMNYHLHSVHSTSTLSIQPKISGEKELRILHCSVCDLECRGENGLDEHRLFVHCKITKSDSCGECHLPISTQSQFIEHCKRHSNDSQMSCVVCRQTLRNVSQLNVHAKFHAFEDVLTSMSKTEKEENEEEISSIPSLILPIQPQQHIPTKPLSPSKLFRCFICGYRFNSQSRLDTHTRKHANNTSATCQICGDQFPKQDQLVVHMQSHKYNLTERARDVVFDGI